MTTPNPAIFMRQLASMITAGIPITRCFDILLAMQPTSRLLLRQIQLRLQAGQPLHQSMRVLPGWYDEFASKLIYLGEETGKLDQVLLTLANHYESRLQLQRQIRQTLLYPVILSLTAILLLCCLFIFVIPAFADFFHENVADLPLLTRLLFLLSAALNHHLYLAAVLLIMLLSFGTWAWYQGKLDQMIKSVLCHLPAIRHYLLTKDWASFTRQLSLTLQAGMPILDALQLTAGLSQQNIICHAIIRLRMAVNTGSSLYSAMQSLSAFPVLLQQMVKVGEEAGQLDSLLAKTASLMEDEVNSALKQLTSMLEPLIMCILGVLIGGLVIGIYLPLFNLGSVG